MGRSVGSTIIKKAITKGVSKDNIEVAIDAGQKEFGFDDVSLYRGYEISTEDVEARRRAEENKLKMLRLISLSIRKLKADGKIDKLDYKIFGYHHGFNNEGIEFSFSAIATILKMDVERVVSRYAKTLKLLQEEVKLTQKSVDGATANN